jgi:RNA polymerase sigma-70 factor (ECF subfamily)
VGPDREFATVTSASLLAGLRDPSDTARWERFVERYRPLIVRFARGLGFAADDAEDLAQEALLAFSKAYLAGRYDPARGRLRSWLFGIVHTRVRDANRRRRDREQQAGDTAQEHALRDGPAVEDELAQQWEAEWRDAVLAEGLRVVRAEVEEATWRAFDAFARAGRPAEEVADELGLTPNAVYGAKRRVLRRLRAVLPEVDEAF